MRKSVCGWLPLAAAGLAIAWAAAMAVPLGPAAARGARVVAAPQERPARPVNGPLELVFRKGVRWRPGQRGYDAKLPGYHLDGEIAELGTRWRGQATPGKLVLAIRTSPGMPPNLEGFTLQSGDVQVSTFLRAACEQVRHGSDPHAPEESVPSGTYFRMAIIGDEVRVAFTPKAIELLKQSCTIRWVDWYRG